MNPNILNKLKEKTKIIRTHIINMTYMAGSGHLGGSLSCVEILTVLYFHIMNHNPLEPKWVDRDRFILSKGHAAPTLYAILAEVGYFPIEQLKSLRNIESSIEGHSDIKVPGVEVSTGSLGQGLSIACGIALSAKIDKRNYKIYTLLGDGECDEGQVWEAAMFASHYKLDNLIAIVDRNFFQIDGKTEEVISLEPFAEKWKAFSWQVIIIDGHSIKEILLAFNIAKKADRPVVIIANTIKGKGISFVEGDNSYHGRCLNKNGMELALQEFT